MQQGRGPGGGVQPNEVYVRGPQIGRSPPTSRPNMQIQVPPRYTSQPAQTTTTGGRSLIKPHSPGGQNNLGVELGLWEPQVSSVAENSTSSTTNTTAQFEIPRIPSNLSFESEEGSIVETEGERWSGLDLSDMSLRVLSDSLWNYTHLAALFLNNNQLPYLHIELCESLVNLTQLDLSRNRLTELPPEIGNLRKLEELGLFHNAIQSLPVELGKLAHLTRLGLDGNPISWPSQQILQQGVAPCLAYLRDRLPPPGPPPPRQWINLKPANSRPVTKFRILCYNVLAEAYATASLYYHCPSWALSWNYRKTRIIEDIVTHEPDVFCLQEVELEQFETMFLPEFRSMGYEGQYKQKTRGKTMNDWERRLVDGCATFVKRDSYTIVESIPVEYSALSMKNPECRGNPDLLNRLMPRDNVGLILVLESNRVKAQERHSRGSGGGPGRYLVVANTHLHWDPAFPDVKMMQIQFMTEQIEQVIGRHAQYKHAAVVLAGDLNSTPDSGAYELLSHGKCSPDHPEMAGYSYGSYSKSGLHHRLPLRSAYGLIGEPEFTNFTCDFVGVLDYIWYGHDKLHVSSILEPVSREVVEDNVAMPNPQFPSDHTPIACDIQVL